MTRFHVNGYRRISKREAYKLFNNGQTFHICPRKMAPGGHFAMSMPIYGDSLTQRLDGREWERPLPQGRTELAMSLYRAEHAPDMFDYLIREFNAYNGSWETGYYPAFYVQTAN